jgi:CBS domain-containing protein
MKASDIMTRNPETVTPGTFIGDVARLMRDLDVGMVPIAQDGKLLGVITDRDITVRVTAAGLNPYESPVQDFMSPNVVKVSPDDDVEQVRQIMADRQIRRVLVVDGDNVVGVISLGDVSTRDRSEDAAAGAVLEEISEPTNLNRLA